MAAGKVSYNQLTHDVLSGSPEPLSVYDILQRVHSIRPVTTRNPKQTIRGAIHEELREQYGMQMDNLDSSRLSPEAKNDWLDYILEFERQFENAKTTTVRERIGNPVVRPIEEIPMHDLEEAVKELLERLYENATAVDFLGE